MTQWAARAPQFSFLLSYLRKQRKQNPNPNRLTMTNARILIVEDEAITVSALKRELAHSAIKSQLTLAPLMKLLMPLNYTTRIWFLWTSLLLEPSMASLPQSPSAATSMYR